MAALLLININNALTFDDLKPSSTVSFVGRINNFLLYSKKSKLPVSYAILFSDYFVKPTIMKLFYTSSFLISVVCLGSSQPVSAQFKGGSGDGVSAGISTGAVALGRNIFTGGNDDGTGFFLATASPLGRNIFTGGNDDGNAVFLAANSPLGRNIFTGGNDDGNASSLAASSPLV